MSNLNRHPVRRAAAGVLAGTLALTGGALATGITSSYADAGFTLTRVAGVDRYETSAAIAAAFGPATSAILTSGETGDFPDALSANFLAGVQNAPVLLTATAATPTVILDALAASGVENITLIGGTDVISAAQEAALTTAGYTVTRVAGADRFATSAAVIDAGAASANPVGLIATGLGFADALGGGPLSYSGNHPMGLVRTDSVPAETLAALDAAGVTSVIILGGTAVVGTAVEAQLAAAGITVADRLDGADRSATSALIAEFVLANGYTDTTFNVASGAQASGGVDALGGAALSGKNLTPLLITNTSTDDGSVAAFATTNSPTLNAEGAIFGGTAVVSTTVEDAIVAEGETPAPITTNQTFAVTPAEAVTQTLVADTAPITNVAGDDRTYNVGGLEAGVDYRVSLVNSDSVRVDANGVVSFLSEADSASLSGFSVNVGADVADILSINGAPATTPNAGVVKPVNGAITFTIDGTATGSVTPVLYKVGTAVTGTATTGGTSVQLETTATAAGQYATPAEQFGNGGATTYVPAEAPALSNSTDGDVVGTDAAQKTFTVDRNGDGQADILLRYVAGDTYRYESGNVDTAITEAQFTAYLSAGDYVYLTGSYNPGSNVFVIDTDIPAAAAGVAAAYRGAPTNNVLVTWSRVANPDVTMYRVDRDTLNSAGAVVSSVVISTVPSNTATLETTDASVAGGTSYRYSVSARNANGNYSPVSNFAAVTVPAAADTTAPAVTSVAVIDNQAAATSGNGFTSSGDQITVVFDSAVTLTSDAQIHFRDADGTVFAVQRGVNAQYTPSTDRKTVFITLTGAPVLLTAGDTPATAVTFGLNPLVTVNSAGVADDATNPLAEINAGIAASFESFVVTFNSPVDPTTLTAADFTLDNGTIGAIVPSANNTVFTVTVVNAVNYVATLARNSVTGASAGNGPASAVSVTYVD